MSSEEPDWIRPASSNGSRDPNARVIVSCGIGRHYRERLRSTVNHCAVHCPETWRLFYDCLPEGCPPHHEAQYAFKIYALKRAIDAGFRYVLWMDTSFQPIASIEPLWKIVEDQGWFVAKQADAKLGSWISDDVLTRWGIARDMVMETPLCYSGIVGLDLKSDVGRAIWRDWLFAQQRGWFNGPHFNAGGKHVVWNGHKSTGWCSDDPRCEGHRHDEAALSLILWALGFPPITSGLLTLESEKGIIGHCVPDYDVVALRKHLMEYADENDGEYPRLSEEIYKLCR